MTRQSIAKWVAPLIAALIFLGGLEILLYLLDFKPVLNLQGKEFPFWAKNDPGHLRFLQGAVEKLGEMPQDAHAYEEDLYLVYRLRPELNIRVPFNDLSGMALKESFPDWTIVTDAEGHRVPRDRSGILSSRAGAGSKKIAFVGGSSFFGWGTDYKNTFVFQLPLMLRKQYPQCGAELVNHAVPGYAMLQNLRVLKGMISSGGVPDVVVLDATSNCSSGAPVTDKERVRLRLKPLNQLRFYLERFRFFQLFDQLLSNLRDHGVQKIRAMDCRAIRVPMGDYEESLQGFVDIAKLNHINLILVGICSGKAYIEKMRQLAQKNHIPHINFYEVMDQYTTDPGKIPFSGDEQESYRRAIGDDILEKDPSFFLLFPDKCHLNPTGHRVLALALMEEIKEKTLLKERECTSD